MTEGIGIDIISVAKLRRLVEHHGDEVVSRVCRPGETEYVSMQGVGSLRTLAGHLAAKEAAYKLLARGRSDIGWCDMEVRHDSTGAPSLCLHGPAEDARRRLGVGQLVLSISHIDEVAVAVVAATTEKEGRALEHA